MSWREISLGEAIKVKHGFAFDGKFFATSGELMVLTPGNFLERGGFRVRPGKERFYVGDFPGEYTLEANDLIVAMTEQGEGLLGSSAWIPESGKYLHNQRLGLINVFAPTLLDKKYLYWLFNSPSVRGQIRGSASGTKVRHTAPERIYRVKASIPPVLIQRRIAHTLDTYDDLIENNQRRIKLLEEAARRLYREWFVALRFPGHERVKVVDGVPRGWERLALSQAIEINPRTRANDDEKHPFVPMQALSESSMVITDYEMRTPTGAKFRNGDTLLARITPCLENGKTGFVQFLAGDDEMASGSTEFIVMRSPANGSPHWVYCFARDGAFRDHAIRSMVGSDGRQRVNTKLFDQYLVLTPPDGVFAKFDRVVKPLFQQIHALALHSNALKQARDALLPRLMSGALAV